MPTSHSFLHLLPLYLIGLLPPLVSTPFDIDIYPNVIAFYPLPPPFQLIDFYPHPLLTSLSHCLLLLPKAHCLLPPQLSDIYSPPPPPPRLIAFYHPHSTFSDFYHLVKIIASPPRQTFRLVAYYPQVSLHLIKPHNIFSQ